MGDEAIASVRKKKDSSVSRAVDLVKQGKADAIVSAGHTGAAVAASTIKLRLLPGIDRAGIAATIPTESNLFVLIDAGANPDAKPIHLLQYGIMGSVYSRHVLGYKNPTIGLLSIGSGGQQGQRIHEGGLQDAQGQRPELPRQRRGARPVRASGGGRAVRGVFGKRRAQERGSPGARDLFVAASNELKKNPLRMAGAALARGAFKSIRKKTNVDEYGGSVLLGVDGICIIAHGSSSALAIKNAIRVALESIDQQVNPHIVEEIKNYYAKHPDPPVVATPVA